MNRRQFIVAGRYFPSIRAAAEHFGVNEEIIASRIEAGWRVADAVRDVPTQAKQITLRGRVWVTHVECAQAYGVHPDVLRRRLKAGESPEFAVMSRKARLATRLAARPRPMKARPLPKPKRPRATRERKVRRSPRRPRLAPPKIPVPRRLAWLRRRVVADAADCWMLRGLGLGVGLARRWVSPVAGYITHAHWNNRLWPCSRRCVNPAHMVVPPPSGQMRSFTGAQRENVITRLARFMAQAPAALGSHWSWAGGHSNETTPAMRGFGSSLTVAHAVWMVYRGPLAKSAHVRAVCGRSWCLNPKHLALIAKCPPKPNRFGV